MSIANFLSNAEYNLRLRKRARRMTTERENWRWISETVERTDLTFVFPSHAVRGTWLVGGRNCEHFAGCRFDTAEAAMRAVDREFPLPTMMGVDMAKPGADYSVTVSPTMAGSDKYRYADDSFRLIGLTGLARSGKDTVAGFLAEEHNFYRYALASPLKKGLRVMLGLSLEHTDGGLKETPIKALGGVTPRRLMQTLGTEWARHNIHDDVWLWLAEAEWKEVASHVCHAGMVITDVRFENEAKFIRDRGGEVWHIERPGRPVFNGASDHVSESGVDRKIGDSVITNYGSLDDLRAGVEWKLRR